MHFYARAVEFAPHEGVLYLVIADGLFATGDYHYGAFALRKAFELDPTLARSQIDKHEFYADPREFETLIKYSPLHNLRPANYPPTLVTTADHDDRVVPGHSFKFAAALQEAQRGPNPTLIRIETSAGHGAGTPTSKRIDAAADILGFLHKSLKIGK